MTKKKLNATVPSVLNRTTFSSPILRLFNIPKNKPSKPTLIPSFSAGKSRNRSNQPIQPKKMEPAGIIFLIFSSLVLTGVGGQTPSAAAGGVGECGAQIQKVMPCLTYATGKASAPTPDCCSSVKEIYGSEPKCLCIIMQQTHNGSAQIKSLGIQEDKLLQLPSACKLQNASISNCPKLLGLDPNSPDAAIFANVTTPAAATGTISSPDKANNSDSFGTKHKPLLLPSSIVLVLAIFTLAI